jgi:hypothetical protein
MILAAALALCFAVSTDAFIVKPSSRPVSQLNLENHIADMIDREVERLTNHGLWRRKEDEKRAAWKEKEQTLPEGFTFNDATEYKANSDAGAKIQMRKDKRMYREDPARYCADRCVATGHCQVIEDIFDMDAMEVQKFCLECVLSDGEEPCELPDKFLEDAGKNSWEIMHP